MRGNLTTATDGGLMTGYTWTTIDRTARGFAINARAVRRNRACAGQRPHLDKSSWCHHRHLRLHGVWGVARALQRISERLNPSTIALPLSRWERGPGGEVSRAQPIWDLRQGTSANPYQYTGQPWDAASNLYTLRARMYDPATGRFLSADPWALDVTNPVERNRYAYVANNPINASDPSGYVATPSYGVNLQPAVRATPAIAALGLVTAKTLLTVSIGALLGYGVARSTDLPDVDVGDVAIDDDLIAISPIFLGCDRGATTSQIRRAAIPDAGSYA